MINQRMTKEQLAVLADDIASMAQEFIDTKDVKSLRNMASNLANMIRIHWPEEKHVDSNPLQVD